MKRRLDQRSLLLLCILLLSGCVLPFGLGSRSGTRDPQQVRLPMDEMVLAFADPESAEDGVWSLLAVLGIGVYTGDGTQIMPGSETQEADFWLYDFEVDSLARMATQEAEPFSSFHALLTANGYPGTEVDLLALYRETYARHSDHPFVELLDEMGVSFSSDQTLTPLQSWLLLLDTFVRPNGEGDLAAARQKGGGSLSLHIPPPQYPECGLISGSGIIPNWGLLQTKTDLAGYFTAVETYYAIHGPMLASAVSAALESSTSKVHEGHNEEGDTVEFTVDVQINYVPLPLVSVGAISCGALVNVQAQPLIGGFESVPVDWQVPFVLRMHTTEEQRDDETYSSGRAQLILQMDQEDSAGIGPYHEEEALVSATLDLKTALMRAGFTDPRLLFFVQAEKKVGPQEVVVSWHEYCDEFTIFFSEVLIQDAGIFSQELFIDGEIPVEIHFDQDPATLEGSAELQIIGDGQLDGCSFISSGRGIAAVSGTASPGEDNDPPMLYMKINHTFQVQMEGDECRGGIPIPIPSGEFSLEMPLRDGESQGNNFNQPMVTGVTDYTLQEFCSD